MVWEPYALAIVFGLVVSAAIYFIIMWPQVEPDDDAPASPPDPGTPAEPGPAGAPGAPGA